MRHQSCIISHNSTLPMSFFDRPFSELFPLFGERVMYSSLEKLFRSKAHLETQIRGGIILIDWIYDPILRKNRIYFFLGQDSLYGTLTDFGGKICPSKKCIIQECFREFNEETLHSFPIDMTSDLFKEIPVIYDFTNVIIFLPICLIKRISSLRSSFYSTNINTAINATINANIKNNTTINSSINIKNTKEWNDIVNCNSDEDNNEDNNEDNSDDNSDEEDDENLFGNQNIRHQELQLDYLTNKNIFDRKQFSEIKSNWSSMVEISSICRIDQYQLANMIEAPNLHPQLYSKLREFLYRAGNIYELLQSFAKRC